MARSTMSALITQVRRLIRDTDEVLFDDDDEIQDVYDEDRQYVDRHLLKYNKALKLYTASIRDLEGVVTDGDGSWTGAPTIAIYENQTKGADEVTPDTWSLRDGSFGFTTAQTDSRYYLSAWVYDPYLAASKLCGMLVLESTLTPGSGETGGAIVGRYDYERAERRFQNRAKARRVELRRERSNRFSR